MADEDVLRAESPECASRRPRTEERVEPDRLARRDEVAERPERVGGDEHSLLRPPERDLAPEAVPDDRAELERRAGNPVERRLVHGDAEAGGHGIGVAAVPVEQDEHGLGLAEDSHPFVDAVAVDRVDQVDLPSDRERVRRACERRLLDPAEAEGRLVAEADGGGAAGQAKVLVTLWRPSTRRSTSSGSV